MYYMIIISPTYWRYSTHKLADLSWSSYRAVCPRHTPNPSHKLQCSVGNPGIPYLFTANSARNPDGQIGARMNYFHGLGKAGLWVKKQASGTRVWVLGSAGGAAVRAAKNPAQQRRGLGSDPPRELPTRL